MSKPTIMRLLYVIGACAPLLLGGCGESTNIQEGGNGAVTQCSALHNSNVVCVPGRFVDDAASNINYECGLSTTIMVRSVTDADGGFACPSGSIAKFSLINPDDSLSRITLGNVKIVLPAQIFGGDVKKPVYFYVTPRLLADETSLVFGPKALNITRLLQTLSDDTVDADLTGHLPSRRVIISDDDKRKITAAISPDLINFSLAPAGDPANPGPGTFDEQVHPFLAALSNPAKHTLITSTQAQAALQKGIYNTVAGIYQVPGGSVLSVQNLFGNSNFTSADLGGMVGYDNGKTFLSSLYMLVDRRGRTLGHGVYSFGQPSGGATAWLPWSDPQPMKLVETGVTSGAFPVWPNGGDLSQFRLQMLGINDAGKYVRIDKGVMSREAVAGSSNIYSELFKEASSPSQLGTWSMGDQGGTVTNVSNGVYTLVHSLATATLMSPDVWSGVTFPLPVTLSIYNKDYSNGSCIGAPRGCKIADVRMVILQDGNIISDRYKTCGQNVDPETLVVNGVASQQELPLGVVASAQSGVPDSAATTFKAMVLLAMFPDDTRLADSMQVTPGYESYIPYLQFGSNLGSNPSLLRVDGGVNQFQTYGTCLAASATVGLCSSVGYLQPRMGYWINGYTTMRQLQAIAQNQASSTIDQLGLNSEGFMDAKRTAAADCPP